MRAGFACVWPVIWVLRLACQGSGGTDPVRPLDRIAKRKWIPHSALILSPIREVEGVHIVGGNLTLEVVVIPKRWRHDDEDLDHPPPPERFKVMMDVNRGHGWETLVEKTSPPFVHVWNVEESLEGKPMRVQALVNGRLVPVYKLVPGAAEEFQSMTGEEWQEGSPASLTFRVDRKPPVLQRVAIGDRYEGAWSWDPARGRFAWTSVNMGLGTGSQPAVLEFSEPVRDVRLGLEEPGKGPEPGKAMNGMEWSELRPVDDGSIWNATMTVKAGPQKGKSEVVLAVTALDTAGRQLEIPASPRFEGAGPPAPAGVDRWHRLKLSSKKFSRK